MVKTPVLAFCFLACSSAFGLAAADFTKIDADGDGQASMEELTAAGLNWNKEQFATADTDRSGALSEAEFGDAAK